MNRSNGKISKAVRQIKLIEIALWQDFHFALLAKFYPTKPIFLQLVLSTDHADALEKWRAALKNSQFLSVKEVSLVIGGESSSAQLPDWGRLALEYLPKLKGMTVIIKNKSSETVLEHLTAFQCLAQTKKLDFKVILDFDNQAGKDESAASFEGFASIAKLYHALMEAGISASLHFPVTRSNYCLADDLLLLCRQNSIFNWHFYPRPDDGQPGSGELAGSALFNDEQRFHVGMFFENLTRIPGLDLPRRLYYRDIAEWLALGCVRTMQCLQQGHSITLYTDRGSPRQDLNPCRHQPERSLNTAQLLRHVSGVAKGYSQKLTQSSPDKISPLKTIQPAILDAPQRWQRVMITGWYGTETTGDKAILGEVLRFVKQRSPNCEIILTTINEKISLQTNRELKDLAGATLVDIAQAHKPAMVESVDAVIMGGGPLMETRAMRAVWRIFLEANRQRKARIIFGCGVGPFHTAEIRQMTAQVLQISTAGFFRDQESYEYALQLAPDVKFGVACDPAFAFIQHWLAENTLSLSPRQDIPRIATLLRANTNEFVANLSKPALQDSNERAAGQFAAILEAACLERGARANLLAMNAPWIGGDDRLFNRLVAGSFTRSELVHVERGYFSLDKVVHSLAQTNAAIAMRYHGHIFCMALGIPFLSIDYTGASGKVYSLARRIGYQQWSIPWKDVDEQRAVRGLQILLADQQYWSEYLKEKSKNLIDQLQTTYIDVFGS
jgi:polysaccharide pyruvyl transferase WcaK-like protein